MSPLRQTATSPVLLGFISVLYISFSSCADKIKTNIIAFETLDEGLINANLTLNRCSQTVYASLEQKTTEPSTSEKAKLWLPKAILIQKLSSDAYNYIEGLKSDLKKEAGLKTTDGVESYKESDKTAVMRLFSKQQKGEELYQRLKKYKQDVLAIDSYLSNTFDKIIVLTTSWFDTARNKQDFTKTFLHDIPTAAALAMLSKFQNNIKVTENKMVNFCDSNISIIIIRYDSYSAIITQNSSYVRANEVIEITSGIGAFSKAALPVVLIDGKNVSIGADGAAHYKLKASDKPGKYSVPVEISFIDQEGQKKIIAKNIEYTVAGQ